MLWRKWKKVVGKGPSEELASEMTTKSQEESIRKGIWRESIPHKGDGRCEWSKAGTYLMCLRYGERIPDGSTMRGREGGAGWGGRARWGQIMWVLSSKILFYSMCAKKVLDDFMQRSAMIRFIFLKRPLWLLYGELTIDSKRRSRENRY